MHFWYKLGNVAQGFLEGNIVMVTLHLDDFYYLPFNSSLILYEYDHHITKANTKDEHCECPLSYSSCLKLLGASSAGRLQTAGLHSGLEERGRLPPRCEGCCHEAPKEMGFGSCRFDRVEGGSELQV